jgi:RNA polymerase sigma-70 factor (ECF subfamily)
MQDADPRADTDLLVAARTSAEAFGVFYERHFASVLAFFRRRTRSAEEAFDLAAETFAAALAAVPRFEPGPEPAVAWLFAIARHKLSEAFRSRRIQDEARRALAMQPIQLDERAIEILEATADAPALELLGSLADEQRHAIEARYLEDRDYAEIAGDLRCSESVIRKRASRGLAALRTQLEKEGVSGAIRSAISSASFSLLRSVNRAAPRCAPAVAACVRIRARDGFSSLRRRCRSPRSQRFCSSPPGAVRRASLRGRMRL